MGTDEKTLDDVLAIAKKQRMAMMTTIEDERLVSRPMAVMRVDDDATFWFFTENHADKAEQLRAEPRINLAFTEDDYLSASGTGEIVHDPELQTELWNPHVKSWLQCEPTDPKVALIKVSADTIGYWDTPSAPGYLLGVVKGMVGDKRPDAGDSGVVQA